MNQENSIGFNNQNKRNSQNSIKQTSSKKLQDLNDKSFQNSKKNVIIKDSELNNYTSFKQNAQLIIQEELKQLDHLATQETYEQRGLEQQYTSDNAGLNFNSTDFTNYLNSPNQNGHQQSVKSTYRNQNVFSNTGTLYGNNQSLPQANLQLFNTQQIANAQYSSFNQPGGLRLSTLNRMNNRQSQVYDGTFYNSNLNSQLNVNQSQLSSVVNSPQNQVNQLISLNNQLQNQSQNQIISQSPQNMIQQMASQNRIQNEQNLQNSFQLQKQQSQQSQQQQQSLSNLLDQQKQQQIIHQKQNSLSNLQLAFIGMQGNNAQHSHQQSIQSTLQTSAQQGQLISPTQKLSFGPIDLQQNNQNLVGQHDFKQSFNIQEGNTNEKQQQAQIIQNLGNKNLTGQNQQLKILNSILGNKENQIKLQKDNSQIRTAKDQQVNEELESRKEDSFNLNFQPSQIIKLPKAQQHQDSHFINQQDLEELNKQKQQQDILRSQDIALKLIQTEQDQNDDNQNNDKVNDNLILNFESSIHSNAFDDEQQQSNQNIVSLDIQQKKNFPHKIDTSLQIKKTQFQARFSVDSPIFKNVQKKAIQPTHFQKYQDLNTSKQQEQNFSKQAELNCSTLRNSKHYQPFLNAPLQDEVNQNKVNIYRKATEEQEDDEYSIVKSEMNQQQKDEAMLLFLEQITYKKQDQKKYNPIQIPPDWVFAKRHAMSRATARPAKEPKEFCRCCGYVIERKPLPFSIDPQQLNFLGSGYPLFYNFIIYCIFMLFTLFMISGGYNLFTNYLGNYCIADEQELDSTFKKRMEVLGYKLEEEETICHKNIFHTFSLANKKDRPELLKIQSYLNLFVNITIMVILMFFRRNQRQIDMEIDASLSTPQDYTIMVKNIPIGLQDIDYKKELTTIFNFHSVPGKVLEVATINLIYDISDLINKENELAKTVKEKQQFLSKHGGFEQCDKHELHEIDEHIEKIEEEIEHLEASIKSDPHKFAGVAFVSFSSEQMKKDCLKENVSGYWEQLQIWWNKGMKSRPSEKDLMWGKHKLLIEEAPEPDDIDWEFIHIPTKNKIFWRFFCFLIKLSFMSLSFVAISAIAKFQSHLIEHSYEEIQHGNIESSTFAFIKSLSFIISAIIVLFNKFVLAEVFHHIADSERWSTKTKLNISFADSLSLGLFLNSAIITYVVEILYYKNYYGPGGFIYTESWVFLWNAILPPLVWIINPYQIYKENKRKKQLQLAKQKMCFLTQQEANELMEEYPYIQGKRYADIMKTMWFTFLYAPCIPLGNFFSMFNLVIYYYIDKYNILRNSTVKENLSKEVSLQMTENLEYITVFFALGNFTFSIHLFNTVEWASIIMLVLGLIYAILPMQDLNQYLFHIEDLDEEITYQQAKFSFKTNYDLLNPITKRDSLNRLVKFKKGIQRVNEINKLKNIKIK
ncbi:transmembrane protein, putative (macronuclear) [Tetrahymena thermophila SB210]|uniref:Transmembrane protein, putative n=1 Tax=Tetrahymena thermophila (strain SB210) TaxID=312017 RepID=I7MHH2_TETTS|nr:transmembrane protein, putative [Tetrahymena thermophila SB210]EAR87534.2 transmembrane protein, putative [Tetrahymena thermophila SB210]|eukprot:XP_001007779.2 transmembrane protein, putative [Tetrahymena thermophila SB210]